MSTTMTNTTRDNARPLWYRGAGVIALAVMAGACASAPPERLYTLSSGVHGTTSSTSGRAPRRPARSVVVAPAALPALVDRPQLVLRADANHVAILEQQRWAEPLRSGVSRVIAEDLGSLLGTWRVSTRDDAIANPDCRVNLDVRRFETTAGGTAIRVEALWTVICTGSNERMGQSTAEEPVEVPMVGAPFDAVVAAQGRALDAVSRDIAVAVSDLASEVALETP